MSGEKKRRKHNVVVDQLNNKNVSGRTHDKKLKLKSKSQETSLGPKLPCKRGFDRLVEGKGSSFRRRTIVKKAILQKTKSFKKRPFPSSHKDVSAAISCKDNVKRDSGEIGSQNLKRRRKRKRKKGIMEIDEAFRLQRRTRYLLIKVKFEQNLIDAYSAEGWKGQSREKIRPERELERAKKQILKCKLGIREAIHQLDLLSSEGRIDDSAFGSDGSVYHEHIICAKCKLREAFPDNDIILCDGTCNRGFHQNCLEPPLSTENIPPGEEGWFCKYCKSKMAILEATNAHLGTNFPMDSNWQDIFKEEAVLPNGRESLLCQGQEWPSDDSEDDDYDPEKGESSYNKSLADSESDASASEHSLSSLRSLEDDAVFLLERPEMIHEEYQDNSAGVEFDGADYEVLCGPRHRNSVDYIKLNDELFGKNAPINEQISEDEDWGPAKRKRRAKESDEVNNIANSGENESTCADENTNELEMEQLSGKIKRPMFRFPRNVVEKLRHAFSENELPSRAIRENLSKELGLESEKIESFNVQRCKLKKLMGTYRKGFKALYEGFVLDSFPNNEQSMRCDPHVNKWFKNARYLALKARKRSRRSNSDHPGVLHNSAHASGEDNPSDDMPSRAVAFSHAPETPISMKTSFRRKTALLATHPLNKKQHNIVSTLSPNSNKALIDFGDDVSLKLLRERVKKEKKLSYKKRSDTLEAEAEAEMEKLCRIKDKLEKLQDALLRFPNLVSSKGNAAALEQLSVIYVPVATLREKSMTSGSIL